MLRGFYNTCSGRKSLRSFRDPVSLLLNLANLSSTPFLFSLLPKFFRQSHPTFLLSITTWLWNLYLWLTAIMVDSLFRHFLHRLSMSAPTMTSVKYLTGYCFSDALLHDLVGRGEFQLPMWFPLTWWREWLWYHWAVVTDLALQWVSPYTNPSGG